MKSEGNSNEIKRSVQKKGLSHLESFGAASRTNKTRWHPKWNFLLPFLLELEEVQMNTGLTAGTFFMRRLIVHRGEVRHRFQGCPDSDPERLLLLFREVFNTEGKK